MKVFFQRPQFTLRTHITLLIEALVIMIVVVTGIITTMREKETLENEIYKRGLAVASDLAKFSASPFLSNDLATLRRFVNHTMTQDYVRYALILDPQGRVVMHSNLGEVGKVYRDRLTLIALRSQGAGCASPDFPEEKKIQCNIYAPIQVSDARLGTVLLGYSYMAVEKEIAKAQQQIFFIGLGTIIIGGGIAYLLATFISLPIIRITESMEKVSKGDLDTVLDLKRNDEIGTLVNSFNRMAEDLGRHRKHLEVLVEARTAELTAANDQLHKEIGERSRAEEELTRSQEKLRELASHLQFIREEERIQIAREIHDELGQALTAIKMDVHWLGHQLPKDQRLVFEKLRSMSNLIDLTVHTVRRISSELRPKLLDDLGISAAIEWQANEFRQRAGIRCDFRSEPEDIILDKARSTAFFRIFQETLTNIARHAQATKVEVILKNNSANVEMIVRDNGKGVTEQEISDVKALGITGMRERAHSLEGELDIFGVPGQGTTVKVSIPLGEKGVPQ
jgi:signal transduction histidine kinase